MNRSPLSLVSTCMNCSRLFANTNQLSEAAKNIVLVALIGLIVVNLAWSVRVQESIASGSIRTVALGGNSAPGTDGTFGSSPFFSAMFSPPVINNLGETAFSGQYEEQQAPPFPRGGTGVWSEGGGEGLSLIVRRHDPAPGVEEGGIRFDRLSVLDLSDSGETVLSGSLTKGTGVDATNSRGIWRQETNGELTLVVRRGDAAPGTIPAVDFFVLTDILVNSEGKIGLGASINPTLHSSGNGYQSNEAGIWREGDNRKFINIVLQGQAALAVEEELEFGSLLVQSPKFNDRNETAFISRLYEAGSDHSIPRMPKDWVVWLDSPPTGIVALVRKGDQAPGTAMGTSFRPFITTDNDHALALNNLGQVAFVGSLDGPEIDNTNSTGIWKGDSANLEIVARTGNHAPGTPAGVKFGSLGNNAISRIDQILLLNDRGQAAFLGALVGPGVDFSNATGIWREELDGELKLVVRKGNLAPGTENGEQFGILDDSGTTFDQLAVVLNGRGQLAFSSFLQGPDVGRNNDLGIWAEDLAGNLQMIAREGDLLDVSNDLLNPDLRTIRELSFIGDTGNSDGRPSGFNNKGQLTFSALFTDGSEGIFVSNLVAIPEPKTLTLLALATAGMGLVRRENSMVELVA